VLSVLSSGESSWVLPSVRTFRIAGFYLVPYGLSWVQVASQEDRYRLELRDSPNASMSTLAEHMSAGYRVATWKTKRATQFWHLEEISLDWPLINSSFDKSEVRGGTQYEGWDNAVLNEARKLWRSLGDERRSDACDADKLYPSRHASFKPAYIVQVVLELNQVLLDKCTAHEHVGSGYRQHDVEREGKM